MNFNWQDLTAMVLVVAALGYLSYRGWQIVVRKKTGGCGGGGCSGCGNASPKGADESKPFVSADQLAKSSWRK
jgi:hypothetical protein